MADSDIEKKQYICKNCGTIISSNDHKCPYCDGFNYAGAEKKYFNDLNHIKDNMEQLEEIPKESYKKEASFQIRRIVKTLLICVLIAALIYAAIFLFTKWEDSKYSFNQADPKDQLLWDRKNFPILDEWYELGEYDKLMEFNYELYSGDIGMKMFDMRKIQEGIIFEAIKKKSNDETSKEIIYGRNESAKSENNANWVKSTMYRLENRFDQETIKQIRMSCQCGYGMDEKLVLLKDLMAGASNMEEFANSEKAKAAGLFCMDGVLYLQFLFCPCPMLADVDKLETKTWCQCTTGYSKVLFEKAFGCEVNVELLKSIKTGDDICLMKIIPRDMVWE